MALAVPLSRFTSRVGGGSAFFVRPKLHAIDGVEHFTMKKQITGFILGVLFGGVAIFTIAADSHRPAPWDYKAVIEQLPYNQHDFYSDALNQAATNGWEIVSSQVVPKSPDIVSTESVGLYIVLRHPKM